LRRFFEESIMHFCTRRTANGRVTLNEERLISTCNGKRGEIVLNGPKEYNRALQDFFGIVL